VLGDEQTWSRWDHITGEAFAGPLDGHRLESWPIRHTTVAAMAAERPDLRVHVSDFKSLGSRFMTALNGRKIDRGSFLPPPFYKSMSQPIDPRLPKLANGLGVIVEDVGRYYPMAALADPVQEPWGDRVLTVALGAVDGVPRATWADGSEPMQLFTRWYGFSFTWPGCSIYGQSLG